MTFSNTRPGARWPRKRTINFSLVLDFGCIRVPEVKYEVARLQDNLTKSSKNMIGIKSRLVPIYTAISRRWRSMQYYIFVNVPSRQDSYLPRVRCRYPKAEERYLRSRRQKLSLLHI